MINIIYEDDFFLAVCKEAKQFIHPMPGVPESKTCLLFAVRDAIGARVYAINRLDRPVSGIVLFAKKPEVVTAFQEIWHKATTQKKYLCLHSGKLENPGYFDSSLIKKGAFKSCDKDIKQESLTLYRPIHFFKDHLCTYTDVEIKTGRYHQIRRHFRKAVMPIIGDRKHGRSHVNNQFSEQFCLDRIFLHGHQIKFDHPYSQKTITLNSPVPCALKTVLDKLHGTSKV